jgi:hypothetical protein
MLCICQVADALNARDCGPCLSWCAANRPRLAKSKSSLEFRCRLQQFVEHVSVLACGAYSRLCVLCARLRNVISGAHCNAVHCMLCKYLLIDAHCMAGASW